MTMVTQQERHVIVVNHLFKHAGSTLIEVMRNNFGPDFLDHRNLIERGIRTLQALPECLNREANVKAVEIHHFLYNRFDMPEITIANFLLLRDPLARLRSTYDFCKSYQAAVLHPYAISMNLREFIHFLAFQLGHGHCDNFVLRGLNNGGVSQMVCPLPTPDMLTTSITWLKSIEILGVVERFDETMVLAEEHLRPLYPNIDLADIPANVTPRDQRALSLDSRESFRAALGEELFHNIMERSALDFELVAEANLEMDRRIAQVENFQQKLQLFQDRCRKLQGHRPL